MNPTILPPWQITQGVGFFQEYRLLDDPVDEVPLVDFDQYTAEYFIAQTIGSAVILSGACTTNADGYLTVSIDQSATATLSTSSRVGGQIAAEAQITITDPTGNVYAVWQMAVRIAGTIQ